MPAGKGKPAKGYHAGKKGSYGCDGYPTISADGTVHGCHPTKAAAAAQARAIWASVNSKKFERIDLNTISKDMVAMGDFVIASCEDEVHAGRVEHVMATGSTGIPGSEYYFEATPDNPAVVVRTLEFDEEDGWEETPYLITVEAKMVTKIPPLSIDVEQMLTPKSNTTGYVVDPFNALNRIEKRNYSTQSRERMAGAGTAMPDGSFPIANETDLRNAIQSVGRAKDYAKAKAHITRRARALGLLNLLPSEWNAGKQKSILADAFDPRFFQQ